MKRISLRAEEDKQYAATESLFEELNDRDLSFNGEGQRAFIVDIDPEMAQRLLNSNFKQNRTLSKSHVKRLAADMRNGEWNLSNDAIVISKDLELGNAQHRLSAIIESQTTQRFIVLFGASRKAFQKFDTGKKRTMEQRITIAGINISAKECAVIRHAMNSFTYPYTGTVEFGYPKLDKYVAEYYLKHKEFLTMTNAKTARCSSFYWAAALKMYAEMMNDDDRLVLQHDHDPLTRAQLFIDICTKGCSSVGIPVGPNEYAAIKLMLIHSNRQEANDNMHWSDKKALRLTILAAHKFMTGEIIQKLSLPKQDPFHSFLHMPSSNSYEHDPSN